MYERSAIVLEKIFNSVLHFNKRINLKTIYKDYESMLEEAEKYLQNIDAENKIIDEFDKIANEIRNIQKEQKKLSKSNLECEQERNELFESLDDDSKAIEQKMIKIETDAYKNNDRLVELRKRYIELITIFSQKQKQRNICSKNRRTEEKQYLELINEISNNIDAIDEDDIKDIKDFIKSDDEQRKPEIINVMLENGKDERVPFNREVIENSVNLRTEIIKKEAECYINIYEKLKKLITELNSSDNIELNKYKKVLDNSSCKLDFYKAEKAYIVSFLDNERVTAVNGVKAHNKIMKETCIDFQNDVGQFKNLEQLIILEITSKATKKAYKELYNEEYLTNIENKEKDFEEELSNMRINSGAIINSDYWRIEEIKNIYKTFQKEMEEKFGRNFQKQEPQLQHKIQPKLSSNLHESHITYKGAIKEENLSAAKEIKEDLLLEQQKFEEQQKKEIAKDSTYTYLNERPKEVEDDIFKTNISDDDVEYIEELEFDDDDYDYDIENKYSLKNKDDSNKYYNNEEDKKNVDEDETDNIFK